MADIDAATGAVESRLLVHFLRIYFGVSFLIGYTHQDRDREREKEIITKRKNE